MLPQKNKNGTARKAELSLGVIKTLSFSKVKARRFPASPRRNRVPRPEGHGIRCSPPGSENPPLSAAEKRRNNIRTWRKRAVSTRPAGLARFLTFILYHSRPRSATPFLQLDTSNGCNSLFPAAGTCLYRPEKQIRTKGSSPPFSAFPPAFSPRLPGRLRASLLHPFSCV